MVVYENDGLLTVKTSDDYKCRFIGLRKLQEETNKMVDAKDV